MTRIKVRKDNDFVFLWSIERGGAPEDLNSALEKRLYLHASNSRYEDDVEIQSYTVNGNILRIEFTPELVPHTGNYDFVFKYTLPDLSLPDNERKCAVDIEALTIVDKSSKASTNQEVAMTSDIAFGLMGKAFTYEDFTPEQISELKKPATDAALLVDEKLQNYDNKIAEINTVKENAITATQNANTATSEAIGAKSATLQVIIDAGNATNLAYQKAVEANTAATNADNARLAIQGGLALKEATANKQNSLATDGTGTKFPTVDAVNVGLGGKQATIVSGTNIKTVNGESLVGSGDLLPIGSLLANYTHTANKEVFISSYDINTDTFTSFNHGLVNNDIIAPTINSNIYGIIPMTLYVGGMENILYYVVNKTDDTFQLSKTEGGASINLTTIATTDLTKWHFEKMSSNITITNLPPSQKFKVVLSGKNIKRNNYYIMPFVMYETTWYSNVASMIAPALYPNFGDCGSYVEISINSSSNSYVYMKGRSTSNNTLTTFSVQDINLFYFNQKDYGLLTSITVLPVGGILFNGFNIKIYKG